MDKNWKIIKNFGYFYVNFLPILYQKVKNLPLIIQKPFISIFRCHAIKCPCPKKLVWKSFLDTILQSRSLCNSQSASISDKDAITPLVIGGVFWSLFSYDFDDFPQAEFHQTSNLVTVPIFKNLYYLRFTQPVRQLHRIKFFHQDYQNCQKYFRNYHWILSCFRAFKISKKCLKN